MSLRLFRYIGTEHIGKSLCIRWTKRVVRNSSIFDRPSSNIISRFEYETARGARYNRRTSNDLVLEVIKRGRNSI